MCVEVHHMSAWELWMVLNHHVNAGNPCSSRTSTVNPEPSLQSPVLTLKLQHKYQTLSQPIVQKEIIPSK